MGFWGSKKHGPGCPERVKKCHFSTWEGSKVSKTAFFRVIRVRKITNSHKTGKNHEKVISKVIKKWPKKHQKGPKVCRKMPFWGSKKAWSWVSQKCQKVPVFDMGGVKKTSKSWNPKTWSKKYSKKLDSKNKTTRILIFWWSRVSQKHQNHKIPKS